jgi:hypothetical protein
MRTYTIEPGEPCYVYQATILCEQCGLDTITGLDEEGNTPTNSDDESTFDSDDYPKGPAPAEGYETCDRMERCLSLADEQCEIDAAREES